MNILIRALCDCDFQTYRTCYSNAEFKHFIYGDKPIDIEESFRNIVDKKNGELEAYLVLYKDSESNETYNVVGFCNFLKHPEYPFRIRKETYAFNGGILPIFFNTGMGIFACASLLKLFFLKHPDADLYASTFHYNSRSTKMLKALGFEQLQQCWYGKNHFLLDEYHFLDNDLAVRLLSRVQLEFDV